MEYDRRLFGSRSFLHTLHLSLIQYSVFKFSLSLFILLIIYLPKTTLNTSVFNHYQLNVAFYIYLP